MTDTPAPVADASAVPASPAGAGAAAPIVPPGYVQASELERVESQRRSLQGEVDRLRAAATPAPVPPAAGGGGATPKGGSGFDPDSFRRQLMADVVGVTAITSAAEKLKSEYGYADPELFDPEILTEYGSVDAFKAAVEADHNRVKAMIDAAVAAANPAPPAAAVPSPLGPGNPAGSTPAGDPTVAQLAGLSPSQLDAYDAANPGVIARVMRAAG